MYPTCIQTSALVQKLDGHTGVVLCVDAAAQLPLIATASMNSTSAGDGECEVFVWEDQMADSAVNGQGT